MRARISRVRFFLAYSAGVYNVHRLRFSIGVAFLGRRYCARGSMTFLWLRRALDFLRTRLGLAFLRKKKVAERVCALYAANEIENARAKGIDESYGR